MIRDSDLLRVLDEFWSEARARAGGHLACRAGCTECCLGPFPISALDVRRLQLGLATLRASRPDRAEAVVARARDAAARLGADLPLGAEAREAYLTAHTDLPCPALDPASGRCDLYEHRPTPCRTFGPPVRIGAQRLPPCRLCFRRANRDEIERARVEPDPEDLEGAILATLEDGDRETLVAHALLRAAAGSV